MNSASSIHTADPSMPGPTTFAAWAACRLTHTCNETSKNVTGHHGLRAAYGHRYPPRNRDPSGCRSTSKVSLRRAFYARGGQQGRAVKRGPSEFDERAVWEPRLTLLLFMIWLKAGRMRGAGRSAHARRSASAL